MDNFLSASSGVDSAASGIKKIPVKNNTVEMKRQVIHIIFCARLLNTIYTSK